MPNEDFATLLDSAVPEMYCTNAFRVLRLPSDATLAAAKREVDRLTLSASLHGAGEQPEAAPQAPPQDASIHIFLTPNAEQAKVAFRRLSSPEQRLIDEFFWFWPHTPGVVGEDEALQGISRDDAASAFAIWQAQANRPGEHSVATHNLAVLNHLAALDLELLPGKKRLVAEMRNQRAAYWKAAYKYWQELLGHFSFWRRLGDRVTALDDPRLPKEPAEQIWSSLPLALLLVNARLAVAYGDQGRLDDVRRQAALLDASGFPDFQVLRAKQLATKPFRARLDAGCKSAEDQTDKDPIHADQIAKDLLDNPSLAKGLATADILFRPEDETRIALHDDLALQVLSSLTSFGNRAEDWETVSAGTQRALDIAAGQQAKEKIQKGLEKATNNARSDLRWRLPGYWDMPPETVKQLELARGLLDGVDVDRAISLCSQALSQAGTDRDRWIIGRTVAICLYVRGNKTLERGMEPFSVKPSYLITDADRSRAQAAIRQAAADLVNALKHDPGNRDVHEMYDKIRHLAEKTRVSIADKPWGARPGVQPKLEEEPPKSPERATTGYTPPPPVVHVAPQRRSSSPLLPIGIAIAVIVICIGAGGVITQCSATPAPVVQYVYISATPKPPTATPRATSTRRPTPTPTRRPTATAKSSPTFHGLTCLRWSEVRASHVGSTVCVYGRVYSSSPGEYYFNTIRFSSSATALQMQDFNYDHYLVGNDGQLVPLEIGDCVAIYGRIRDNASYLIITPDKDADQKLMVGAGYLCD